jgi:[acyl-carrier-protein] S-malonyltransferase
MGSRRAQIGMKIGYLFPGQGAQYPGMAKDFFQEFATARKTFEEAEDLIGKKLTTLVFEGPKERLTETVNSQVAIFVTSIAILRTVESLYPKLAPSIAAGLSLGEYSAVAAANILPFSSALKLVKTRGTLMNDACQKYPGTMAVILGLSQEQVEEMVARLALPNDLWAANFNCPGQVVISGTLLGVQKGIEAAKALGAKRALPLDVHGAFHSGLMKEAEKELAESIEQAPFSQGRCPIVMNVSGEIVTELDQIKKNLIYQLTHPVRWEQSIRSIGNMDLYIEMGPGKTLSGFNKRMDVSATTLSVEKVEDLKVLEKWA